MTEHVANRLQVISSSQADYDAQRCVSRESPCPYLPGQYWRSEAYLVDRMDGSVYERLMERGFRRSGHIVYRPRCRTCRECQPFRVRVDDFVPTRSMRRVLRQNADISVEADPPTPTEEKFEVYLRYLLDRHDGPRDREFDAFRTFLYESSTETIEFTYRLDGRVIGASLADRVPRGLSSVYMYFDPDFGERSLGTFSVLWEIEFCRRAAWPFYYLGYYVAGSSKMAYKARFQPGELLASGGTWAPFPG